MTVNWLTRLRIRARREHWYHVWGPVRRYQSTHVEFIGMMWGWAHRYPGFKSEDKEENL